MNALVGTRTVESAEALRHILTQYKTEDSQYFLRWAHQVSGFIQELPTDFPSPEGQMFNRDRELRWKQQGNGFSVLLLSTVGDEADFSPIGKSWTVQDQNAHVYPTNETRFPRGIASLTVDVGQRYFIDVQTSTVHFVALTVKN